MQRLSWLHALLQSKLMSQVALDPTAEHLECGSRRLVPVDNKLETFLRHTGSWKAAGLAGPGIDLPRDAMGIQEPAALRMRLKAHPLRVATAARWGEKNRLEEVGITFETDVRVCLSDGNEAQGVALGMGHARMVFSQVDLPQGTVILWVKNVVNEVDALSCG